MGQLLLAEVFGRERFEFVLHFVGDAEERSERQVVVPQRHLAGLSLVDETEVVQVIPELGYRARHLAAAAGEAVVQHRPVAIEGLFAVSLCRFDPLIESHAVLFFVLCPLRELVRLQDQVFAGGGAHDLVEPVFHITHKLTLGGLLVAKREGGALFVRPLGDADQSEVDEA